MWDGVESGPNRVPVRICCKGAPGRDRPRTKARNINDSLSALRLDRGLCNRFGQTTPPRPLGEAVTGLMATMTGASTTGRGPREDHSARENLPQRARSSLDPRDRRVTREHVCQRYVLAGQVTCSAVTRRSRGLSDDLAGWRRHDMRDSVPPCGRLAGASAGPEPPPTTSPSIPPRPAPSITPLVLPRRKKVAGAYFWGCLAGSDLRLMASFRRFSGGRARAGTLKVCAGHLLAPPEPQQ